MPHPRPRLGRIHTIQFAPFSVPHDRRIYRHPRSSRHSRRREVPNDRRSPRELYILVPGLPIPLDGNASELLSALERCRWTDSLYDRAECE
jgi:hypothetical protein